MSTTDKMSENLQKYRARLGEIRADWTRSDEAKRQDLEAAYTEARGTHGACEVLGNHGGGGCIADG